MLNWLLETTSLIVLLSSERDSIFESLLYLLINSCGTPMVRLFNSTECYILFISFFLIYFMGIEENRRLAREQVKSRMKIFSRNKEKVAPIKDKET